MLPFMPGSNRLFTVRGKYREQYATYVEKFGIAVCSVKLDGDNRERNLQLTSVLPLTNNSDNGNSMECNKKMLLLQVKAKINAMTADWRICCTMLEPCVNLV